MRPQNYVWGREECEENMKVERQTTFHLGGENTGNQKKEEKNKLNDTHYFSTHGTNLGGGAVCVPLSADADMFEDEDEEEALEPPKKDDDILCSLWVQKIRKYW
jgi:hypothetical protein